MLRLLLTNLTVKDKYGSDLDESGDNLTTDSESDESEDENGEELTPTMDAAIFRTLARIKRKDPEIYDTNKGIFNGRPVYSSNHSVIECLFR